MLSTKKTKRTNILTLKYKIEGNKIQVNFNKKLSSNKKTKKEFVPKGLISFL
jgi:hypothetical protein